VPDWPTNIAYFCTTDAEETAFYNSLYGPGGKLPFFPTNQTYAQLLDFETNIALGHVSTGSVYSHTFHIANARDYSTGKTLVTDWVDKVMSKYSALYNVPLVNTQWTDLAGYAKARTGHFAELTAGARAVYYPTTNQIKITSPAAGSVTVTGTTATGAITYGTDHIAPVTLTANVTVTVTASPRP
jgi:hypothetical protein